MKKILALHGPNLNRLGYREPKLYGNMTLEELNNLLTQRAQQAGFALINKQSNEEAELIKAIHNAMDENLDYIIFNPAAFTHTSIALRDALLEKKFPFIEVHLSNIYAREPFRQHSYFSDIAAGVISGFGIKSYILALEFVIDELSK